MRIITGAILIVGAIWLFTSALPYGNNYGNMPGMIKLAFVLAGLTAILGAFYLFVGSVEAKENARWYQFTIKSILALTVMVALFFSGRALGLRESQMFPAVPPSPYSSYSTAAPVYSPPAASWRPVPINVVPYVSPESPSTTEGSANQESPQPVSNPTPSTPPNQEPDHKS